MRCVWVLRAHPSAPREAVLVPSPRGRTKPLAPTAPHCRGFVSSSLVLAPVVLGFVLPVAFCRQSREPGKGSCCLLGHTVGLFSFYIRLLWFCSCFSLECLCALCFASLAGFAAQPVGAPRSADWTALQRFLACSAFGVNIPSPGGVVLILKSKFSAELRILRAWGLEFLTVVVLVVKY